MRDGEKTKKQLINELIKLREENTVMKEYLRVMDKKSKQAEVELINYRKHIKEMVIERSKLEKTNQQLKFEIAECKLAEKTLHESEAFYKGIINTAMDGFIILDLDTNIKEANPQANKMYGYTYEEFLKHNAKDMVHPDYHYLFKQFKKDMQEKGYFRAETVDIRKDGTAFNVDIKGVLFEYKGEKLILTINRDITDRKKVEKELIKANQQVTDILESITDAFFALDSKWRFTYFNQEAERIFKRNRKEVIGKNIWDEFPTYFESDYFKIFSKSMNDSVVVHTEGKGIFINKWVEIHVYPSNDGISVYYKDISERKKMEEALRLSEERFSKAFNYSPVSMSIYALDTKKYIAVNESWLKMYGYSSDEIIGHSGEDIKVWVEMDDRTNYVKDIEEKGFAQNFESRACKKSGEIFTVLVSGVAINLDGEKCVLTINIDITELKRFQKEISRLDRLSLIGEMAAGIAHEVRNPMTTVRGFLQMIGSKEDYVKYKEYHEIMIEELDRANSIINEFLSLARDKADNLKLQNLNSILETIYPLIKADATNSNKDVKIQITDVPNVLLNEKELRQLLLNLTRNGLEAMPSYGCLTIKTFADHEEVILLVQDEGNGIESEFLEKLGTPFFTTKPDGTGLGLAISYSIAKRHNAKIEVKSSPKGTSFYVRFKVPE
ncbi:MAG: PAS domain S-box protein [Firmicutes bacterium]|nr:PAS domain S-box protein [Bacillota bacterium]